MTAPLAMHLPTVTEAPPEAPLAISVAVTVAEPSLVAVANTLSPLGIPIEMTASAEDRHCKLRALRVPRLLSETVARSSTLPPTVTVVRAGATDTTTFEGSSLTGTPQENAANRSKELQLWLAR